MPPVPPLQSTWATETELFGITGGRTTVRSRCRTSPRRRHPGSARSEGGFGCARHATLPVRDRRAGAATPAPCLGFQAGVIAAATRAQRAVATARPDRLPYAYGTSRRN